MSWSLSLGAWPLLFPVSKQFWNAEDVWCKLQIPFWVYVLYEDKLTLKGTLFWHTNYNYCCYDVCIFLFRTSPCLIFISISMYISGSTACLQTSEFASNTDNLSLFKPKNKWEVCTFCFVGFWIFSNKIIYKGEKNALLDQQLYFSNEE